MSDEELRTLLENLRNVLASIESDMTAADRTPFGDVGMLLDNSCVQANLGLDMIAIAIEKLKR